MKFFLSAAAAALLVFASTNISQAAHPTVETSTQGASGKTNPNANPDNKGQTTTTTTGPKGQLDKGNTGCNNCETETDPVGNKPVQEP